MAIQVNPKLAAGYFNRANVHDDRKQYDRAIADYSKAIELNSKWVSAYYNRGSAFLAKGNRDQAIADYRRALRLDPTDQATKDALKRLGASP
jgi:tetratricopeptide (TPR) repeat protein